MLYLLAAEKFFLLPQPVLLEKECFSIHSTAFLRHFFG
jgi:hypothetical protein